MKQSNFNLYVIADALDHFRLMEDPYEYHDCEGVESIEDIAEHLFDAKYRNEVIQWLKEKAEFYSSNEELNAPDDTWYACEFGEHAALAGRIILRNQGPGKCRF